MPARKPLPPDTSAEILKNLHIMFGKKPFDADDILRHAKHPSVFSILACINPAPLSQGPSVPTTNQIKNWFTATAGTPYGGLVLTRDHLGRCTIALADSP